MNDCHVKLHSKFILIVWVFILLFDSISAKDESNYEFDDNVRSKRRLSKDEVLVFESPNLNVDEGVSQAVRSRETQGRINKKLNLEKDSFGSESDVKFNDEADQEEDNTDDKGSLFHSVGDRNAREHTKARSGPKLWDHWGKWTSCSVSCGVGKMTRWRHCVSGSCATGEKEAQIKTCSLASC